MLLNNAYDWRNFFTIDGSIAQISIATAYSDPETIGNIFNCVQKNFDCRGVIFNVFIDQNASRALYGQNYHNSYCNRTTRIKNHISTHTQRQDTEDSGIFLVDLQRLFHSKFIFIRSSKMTRLVIGSINMTVNGVDVEGNEELIYIHDNPNSGMVKNIYQYIDFLYNHSTPVRDAREVHTKNSLRDFFLNGKLYIQFDKIRPFRFDLDLPQEIIRQQPLHPLIDIKNTSSINILHFCKNFNPNNERVEENIHSQTPQWKKFCVETNYGYWAPNEYIDRINEILDEKGERGSNLLKAQLQEIQTEEFNTQAQNFFSELANTITGLGFEWKYQERWDNWLRRLQKKLFDADEIRPDFFDKLVSGVITSEMPDIWDSTFHREMFVDSFLESLQFSIDRPNTRNCVAKCFLEKNVYPETSNDLAQLIRNIDFTIS